MTMGASLRYLGIAAGAPPRRLLGLPDGPITVIEVDAALAQQRLRVQRHPAGDEPAARRLLHTLDVAADALREHVKREEATRDSRREVRSTAARGGILCTPFDREVLSTLAEAGGWNSASKPRVLAIAARYGIGSTGVEKVIHGLAAGLRSGALRPREEAIAKETLELESWQPAEPSRLTVAFEQLDEALSREVAGDTPARLLRLIAFFLGIAILGVYLLYAALAPSPPAPMPTIAEAPMSPAERERTLEPPVTPATPLERADVVTPARWPTPPHLKGKAPPEDARKALREVVNGPSDLMTLARKMQVEANRPSEAIFQVWDHLQGAYARCWPLLDSVARTAAIEASVAVLKPVQADEVATRLLAPWSVDPAVVDDALGPWRGAWSAGLLGEVASRPSTGDSIAAQAIDRLETMVPRRALLKGRGTTVFDGAAGAWLDKAARSMVVTVTDPEAFADRWERWFEAQAAVRSGAAVQGAYLDAIGVVLASGLALSDAGPGSDLLGRLVASVDWTDRSPDQRRARDAMTLWFTDHSLPASRLWVLTSMLDLSYEAAWFVPEFVCDPESDYTTRGNTLDRITAAWPMPKGLTSTGGGIVVDSRQLERWHGLVEKVEAMHAAVDADRLLSAVLFARLNTAAQAFASRDDDLAQADLAEIERELSMPRDRRGLNVALAGHTSGTDGEFTTEYQEAGREEGKRRDALRALRSRPAAGDLGVHDAEVLVNEALRGSPTEIRGLAQEIIADHYSNGPIVLQELLDQIAATTIPDATVAMLERVTGERLGDARGQELARQVRLALLHKLLSFEASDARAIDLLSRELAAAYIERSRLFALGFEEPPPGVSPESMATRLASQWRLKAGSIFLADPFPAPLEELDRRRGVRMRLADGGVQRCVAEQASLIELMAAVAVADKPGLRQRAAAVLSECADRRARAGSVVEQVLETERSMTRIYDLWFEAATAVPVRVEGAT